MNREILINLINKNGWSFEDKSNYKNININGYEILIKDIIINSEIVKLKTTTKELYNLLDTYNNLQNLFLKNWYNIIEK